MSFSFDPSRRRLLVLAGAVAATPGAAWSLPVAPQASKTTPFFRGMNFGYLSRQGFYGSEEAKAQGAAMKAAGVEWVSLMVMLMQETFYSTRVYKDFTFTPDDVELTGLIRAFKAAGLKVLLKPVIDIQDSSWRGRISFPVGDQQIQGVTTDYWTPWFSGMRLAIGYYARLAEREKVEGFTIAQELYGADSQTAQWLKTIETVRAVYSGQLVVNIDGRSNPFDPALRDWIKELDAVGVSFYPALNLPGVPDIATIRAALEPERQRLARAAESIGRKLYFAEFGVRSVAGALSRPTYDYSVAGGYDGVVQANYLEALLETFWNEPWWAGFQLWKWDEQQNRPHYHQAGGDAGFTVSGKPAEQVLARWAKRPLPRHATLGEG